MEATLELDTLNGREIVSLKSAAKAAGLDQRTLCARLAEAGFPIIWLGPRKRGLKLAHFDRLIANCARPAKGSAE